MKTRKGVAVSYAPGTDRGIDLNIKKQSVLDRMLRSYKDTPHGPGDRVRTCGLMVPKSVSEPSSGTLAPSLALSAAPAVPLWNSFALLVSGAAFVFWGWCGIAFCILKEVPSGCSDGKRKFNP